MNGKFRDVMIWLYDHGWTRWLHAITGHIVLVNERKWTHNNTALSVCKSCFWACGMATVGLYIYPPYEVVTAHIEVDVEVKSNGGQKDGQ